jgi:hypothetical protein
VLFEKLYVRDGAIIKYVARREHREEVEALIALAVGAGLEYDHPTTGRGSNLTKVAREAASYINGKGGVLLRVRLTVEAAGG